MLKASRHGATFFCLIALGSFFFLTVGLAQAGTVVEQGSEGLFILEGGKSTLIYNHNVNGFGVSPNGQQVTFTPFGGEQGGFLLLYDIPGKTTEVVSSPSEDGMGWSEPRFSSNGEEIIATSQGGIFSIDTNGSHVRRLVADNNASWPVMSSDGYLAYLDAEQNLYVLSPSEKGEASEPRLIALKSSYSGVVLRPSFSPEGHDVLYPTTKGSYVFNAETGEQIASWPLVYERPEWEASGSLLEMNGTAVIRRYIGSWKTEPVGSVKSGSWVRTNQPSGKEVEPPYAPISPEQLLQDFRPILKYDSQEPYRAIPPNRIAWPTGFNEEHTKITYVNLLKRGERVLADPYHEYPGEAEEYGYTPQGIFGLQLGNLGSSYPAYASPDENALANSEDDIDEHNETHVEDADSIYSLGEDSVLGHTVLTEDGAWLQYWMFYYYNNGVFGVDDHEGDWEMVQVHLSKESGYLPNEVVFSQHSYAARCEVGEYLTEGEAPGPGGAPVVYVANGSHASYPEEGEYETEVPFVFDSVFPNEEEIPAVRPYLEDLDVGENNWLGWPGHWGGSENSPPGPVFHESQWDEPGVWAGEAEGCTSNKAFALRQANNVSSGGWSLSQGQSQPLELTAANFRDGRVHVTYRAAGLAKIKSGWPRMLLTVDSNNPDGTPPKAIVIRDVKREGTATLPFQLDPGRRWRVQGSLDGPAGRTPVVGRPVSAK